MDTRILIVGSGALACLFAARLAASELRVGMLGTWTQGLDALREHGVCVIEPDGSRRCFPVQVSSDPRDFAGTQLAIVLVKSWQTAHAAEQLAGCLSADGLAVTLQNGLGNLELLAQSLGTDRAAAGVTTLGAALDAPGVTRFGGSGEVILGAHPRIEPLRAVLAEARLSTRVETSVLSLLWGKLVINAAINPVTALLGMTNGQVLANSHALALSLAAAREAEAVAAVLGIQLPYPDAARQVEAVLRGTGANRSSMLQDLERGAPTEIDAINGAVVQAGRETGLDCPVNLSLFRLVKARSGQP